MAGEWSRATPYGAYGAADSSYEKAQFGSLGSGALGGWSFAGWGGAFEALAPAEAELREELARQAGRPPPAADPARRG